MLSAAVVPGLVFTSSFSAHAATRQALPASHIAQWHGIVTYVVDGDTLYVRPAKGGKAVSVRIDGIDAPEICQTGGVLALQALRQRVLWQQVLVVAKGHDRYGRLVAGIYVGNIDQGAELVAAGRAWAFRFEVGRGPYAALQRGAEDDKIGMFSAGQRPQTPAAFRKMHGSCY